MLAFDIPAAYRDLSPIIITSPTTRCGTTLVQRLITASDTAFIYGEEIGLHMATLADWLVGMMAHLEHNEDRLGADFRRALNGTLTEWRPGLTPPPDVLLQACLETFYQIPASLAAHGRSIGRPVWGCKCPTYAVDVARTLLSLMPATKIIYIVRNPFDALRSAKARKFVSGPDEIAAFCASWNRNVSDYLDLNADPRVFFVQYENMLAAPEKHLDVFRSIAGASAIDAKAFDLKVNTFVGETSNGHSPTGYIDPAPLTGAERAAVLEHADGLVKRLYGRSDPLG